MQGLGLNSALKAAAHLRGGLPANVIVSLLRHEAPEIRAGGCRRARRRLLPFRCCSKLLEDPDSVVAREAACCLRRMGRIEVRPILLQLLQQAPCAEVINAISAIADDECLVILGRIARTRPDLEDAAREALDSIGSPGAMKIAAASRRLLVVARRQLTDRSKRAPGSKLEMLRSERTARSRDGLLKPR